MRRRRVEVEHRVEVSLIEATVRVLHTKPGDVVVLRVPIESFPPPEQGSEEPSPLACLAQSLRDLLPDDVTCMAIGMDGDIEVSVIEAAHV